MKKQIICDNCPFPADHTGTTLHLNQPWRLCEKCYMAPHDGRMLDHVRADRISEFQLLHGAASAVVRRAGEVHIPVSTQPGCIAWITMRPEPRNSPYAALYTGYVMRLSDAHTCASLPCQSRDTARGWIIE